MISEIEIKNFRSIISERITLEPLTVLIGANGSGKSNLVKALEFISELPRSGLDLAVSKQGGRDSLLPKNIPLSALSKTNTSFKYRCCLPPPPNEAANLKSVDVIHEFEFSLNKNGQTKVKKESIEFQKVLYVGRFLKDESDAPIIEEGSSDHPSADSTFSLFRQGSITKYETNPKINNENLPNYLYWLGLDDLRKKITRPDELDKFLKNLRSKKFRKLANKELDGDIRDSGLLVDPDVRTIVDFSPQAGLFHRTLGAIKRYDLLLHELRREQDPSDSSALSKAGGNLPAALRKLTPNKDAFRRLKSSFSSIAPHILNMKASSLKTGKEFVEFVESASGRDIESWQSSDGSLRALAILVALETARSGDTVIIEEPEQNLHPWAIRVLVDHIREIVKSKSVQIILTTHSEHVLDRVFPDEIRVVSRSQKEGSKFKRIDEIITKGPLEIGEIGRLWVKGLLGGVPQTNCD